MNETRIETELASIQTLSDMRSHYNCFDPAEEPKYRALSAAIQALNATGVTLTKAEAESLLDWLEINLIQDVKDDPDCDSMEWLCNMVSIYKKCKEVVENGRTM